MKIRTFSAAAVLLAAGSLSAQPPKPLPPAGAAPVAGAGTTFRAKQVLGTKILIQNNTAVGTVDDLVFDDAGNLEYMIVATGDNKLLTVPFEAGKFDLEKKTVTLSITPEVYRTIPTYTVTTYPQFYTPAYRTDIYKVYGLTPRDLRRLDRRNP